MTDKKVYDDEEYISPIENTLDVIYGNNYNFLLILSLVNFLFLSMIAVVQLYYIGSLSYESSILLSMLNLIWIFIELWMLSFLFNIVVGITKDIRSWKSNKLSRL